MTGVVGVPQRGTLAPAHGKPKWKTAIDVMNKEKMKKQSVFEQILEIREVTSWPTWDSEAKQFPWTYEEHEECYITEGRATVTPEGGEPVDIGQGDFVTFPKGMSCTWDVQEPLTKHFNHF